MKPEDLGQSFESYLTHKGLDPRISVRAGVQAMLSFYADERADSCNLAHDQDMLLFQWGTYDSGDGPRFELDIARQVILPEEIDDDAIWQLHVMYSCPPSPELHSLGAGHRWCPTPDELGEFRRFVDAAQPFVAVQSRRDMELELRFEKAG